MAANSDHHLSRPSLSDQARDRLRAAILEGELKPGEKINIERVAEKFGISRTPIREALKALETEGLVQIKANSGAIVEPHVWEEIRHRYRMRGLLEGYAAELSCEHEDQELIAKLRENCALAKKESQVSTALSMKKARTIADLNRRFHRLIWLGSGSLTLLRYLESLDLPQSFNDALYKEKSSRDIVCQHHEEIVEAFVQGNAQRARMLMERHIQLSANLVASHAGDTVSDSCC